MNLSARHHFSVCLRAVVFFAALLACACNSGSQHTADALLDESFRLLKERKLAAPLRYIDSVAAQLPRDNGWVKEKIYQFKKEYYYQRENSDSNSLYNDSIIFAIEHYELTNSLPAEYANALNNKGNRFYEKNELNAAFDYYYKSKIIAAQLNDTCLISDQTYHMGMVSYRQERFADAAKYFRLALSGNDACRDAKMTFYRREELINNIALSFAKLLVPDSAIYYYDQALNYVNSFTARNSGDTDITKFASLASGVIITNIATEFMSIGKYDTAAKLLVRAIEINSAPRYDSLDVTYGKLQLAKVYVQQGKLPAAAALLSEVDLVVPLMPGRVMQQEWLNILHEYHKKKHDPEAALTYLERYNTLRDSTEADIKKLRQVDFTQILRDQENQYQLDILKKDNQLKRLYLIVTIGIVVVALVIVILAVGNYHRSARNVKTLTALNEQISEQKEQQDKTMNDLVQSNRDMDRILHVVAHDLRSPVSATLMMCNLIADEITDPSQKEILDMMVTSSKSQLALIGELLEFSGSEIGQDKLVKEVADLNELCKQAASILYFKADEKKQSINVTFSNEPVLVNCSREKINRLISNLVTNAIKFSPEGSMIHVNLRKKVQSAVIEIRDEGIGIPEKSKAILFDAFTSAKRYGTAGEKSFGIGLSICKQIVEAHQGKIWFESQEGKGSTFFIELPLA